MKMLNVDKNILTELPEEKVDCIKKEYSTENLEKVIINFKKKISLLYLKKKEVANKYSLNKNKYSAFIEGINELILRMDNIEPDPLLKELLIKKIDEYYSLLDLKNIKELLDSTELEMEILLDSIKLLTSIHSDNACPICFEDKIKYFIDPCGHTVCERCKCGMGINCFYCRTEVKSFKRLYLSD